ncbi:MAG: hypothetical protein JXP73_05715 [Deltaproteobacteria bacterium]|nr:hypothetical protein [Deltaproteobacteria bacterium]
MLRWRRSILLLAAATFACGRTTTGSRSASDGGDAALADATADLAGAADGVADLASPEPRDTASPLADLSSPEASSPLPDASSPDLPTADLAAPDAAVRDATAADTTPPLAGCAALRKLAEQDLLLKARSNEIHFAPDLGHVVLRVRADASAGTDAPDRLVRVDLPSGAVTPIVDTVYDAEALGTQGALLLFGTGSQGKDTAVYDGKSVRTLTSADVCDHQATRDGSRLFVLHDCIDEAVGDLDVIDVATGQSTPLAKHVPRGSLAVSPGGGWVAFATRTVWTDEPVDTLNVADSSNATYSLASQRDAVHPAFVSESLLVFRTAKCSMPSGSGCEVRGHVPGTGDISYLIDTRDPGAFGGYAISPDRTLLLTAEPASATVVSGSPARLYAASIDGTGQRLLASNLFPYWLSSMAVRAFAFDARGQYVLYVSSDSPHGVYAVDVLGGSPRNLSSYGTFQLTATGGSVVLFEHNVDSNGGRVRLAEVASGTDRLSFATGGDIWIATPLAGDQALLFVEHTAAGPSRLRFLSSAYPDSLVLGEWQESLLARQYPSYAGPQGLYPVDPTGCFTIVDTDLAPGPGTRLVLLPK